MINNPIIINIGRDGFNCCRILDYIWSKLSNKFDDHIIIYNRNHEIVYKKDYEADSKFDYLWDQGVDVYDSGSLILMLLRTDLILSYKLIAGKFSKLSITLIIYNCI